MLMLSFRKYQEENLMKEFKMCCCRTVDIFVGLKITRHFKKLVYSIQVVSNRLY